jgi:hypothetical protein
MLHATVRLELQAVDATARPVPGALFHVQVLEPWSQAIRRPLPVRSDHDGRSTLTLDAPTMPFMAIVCAQQAEQWSSRHLVLVKSETEGPLVLHIGTPRSIEGTIARPDGAPATGAVVRALGPNGAIEATIAEAAGRFRLPVGTAGSWTLSASAGQLLSDDASVRVEPAAAPPVVAMTLLQPGHVSGRVLWADSSPAAGIEITLTEIHLSGRNSLSPSNGWMTATTDDDGLFAIRGLHPSSSYLLHPFGRLEPIEPQSLRVEPGQDIQLSVERATRAGELVGSVVDRQTGQPVSEFAVRLSGAGDPDRGLFEAPAWTSVRDDQGEFRLAPGRMQGGFVWVSAPGYAPTRQGPIPFSTDPTTIQITLSRQ